MLDMSKLLQNKGTPPTKRTPPPPPESETAGSPTADERLAELREEEKKVTAEVEVLEAELERAHKAGDSPTVKRLRLARRELFDRAADLARDIPNAEKAIMAARYAADRRQLVADVESLTAQHRQVLPEIEAFYASAIPLFAKLEAMHYEGQRLHQRMVTYEARTGERLEGVPSTERLWRAAPGLAGPIGKVARAAEGLAEYRRHLGDFPTMEARREAEVRASVRQTAGRRTVMTSWSGGEQSPTSTQGVTWWPDSAA